MSHEEALLRVSKRRGRAGPCADASLALAPAILLLCAAACREDAAVAPLEPLDVPATWPEPPSDYRLPPPPLSEGVFPCSDCHDPEIPVNTERRELQMAHQEIELRHDQEHRWCLDCHDSADRDMLHLAGGELVPFEESHRLCGQCHGDKHRDWRAGVHGRRSGRWDGEKTYLLCVHCHDSHAPAFEPMAPMPAPARPRRTP